METGKRKMETVKNGKIEVRVKKNTKGAKSNAK